MVCMEFNPKFLIKPHSTVKCEIWSGEEGGKERREKGWGIRQKLEITEGLMLEITEGLMLEITVGLIMTSGLRNKGLARRFKRRNRRHVLRELTQLV